MFPVFHPMAPESRREMGLPALRLMGMRNQAPNLIRAKFMRTVRATQRHTTTLTVAAFTAGGVAIALKAAAIDCVQVSILSEHAARESKVQRSAASNCRLPTVLH